jgi:hypothetical protein
MDAPAETAAVRVVASRWTCSYPHRYSMAALSQPLRAPHLFYHLLRSKPNSLDASSPCLHREYISTIAVVVVAPPPGLSHLPSAGRANRIRWRPTPEGLGTTNIPSHLEPSQLPSPHHPPLAATRPCYTHHLDARTRRPLPSTVTLKRLHHVGQVREGDGHQDHRGVGRCRR